MTEEQLHDAYGRLGTALAPPADAPGRVQATITRRRHRRRAGLAGAAAAVVLGAAGGVLALSGEGSDGTTVATDDGAPASPTSTLVLTRPDGSTYAFSDVTVSCEPPKTAAGDPLGEGRGRIWMYSPIDTSGSEDGNDVVVEKPFVYFEGRVDKLAEDTTFTLPVDGPGGSNTYPLTLFMADPAVGANRPNEVSSAESGATGTVRVLRASCDPTPVLELEVDATLGSEVQQGALQIAGAYR